MSSLLLLQRTLLSSSSLFAVSCCSSKLLSSSTQITSRNFIRFSSILSSCARTLGIKHLKQDSSGSAHVKTIQEDLKSILERLNQKDVKSSLDCLPENKNGFEVVDGSKKDRLLLKKQAAGETIHILANGEKDKIEFTADVIKKDGTCLEFHCYIGHNENIIDIWNILIKEKGDSSNIEDYSRYDRPDWHHKRSPFKLEEDRSEYWLHIQHRLGLLFNEFLVERGIDMSMTEWIRNYMLNKHKVEKSIWLENVKNFIDK